MNGVDLALDDVASASLLRGPINFDNSTSEERADPSYVCFDHDVNNISTASISAFGAKIVNDLQLRKQFDSSEGLMVWEALCDMRQE